MSELTAKIMCPTCPLRSLPEGMRLLVDVEHGWGLSQRQFVTNSMRDGVPPDEVASDLIYEYRAYPEQVAPLIHCVGRQALAEDCVIENT